MHIAVPLIDTPVVSPVLVGRTRELEILERALHAAQLRTGQCVVIAGQAGVGKSRLLTELRHRASVERFLTLQGSCFEQDSSFPYAPLVDALRVYLAQHTPPEIREVLGPLAAEIVKLVPELALILPDLEPTPVLDPEAEKRRLFESLCRFFTGLAASQPLLIILEDLHWSDNISLDFLHLFARRLTAHPILLLASYRQEEAPSHLTHLLAQFDREHLAREISLAPLTRADVNTMLCAIFNLTSPLKADVLDALYAFTEGNPFWLEEVLKTLIGAGTIFYTSGRWEHKSIEGLHIPRSVQDAVQRRTAQLGAVAQEILTLAAVAGRRFRFALLHESTGLNEQELLQVIKQLIAAQLVVEEQADQFAFRHALTREVVYATLLQRERTTLHQRVAETLERIFAQALDRHVGDLAYHFFKAGTWDRALHYSRRAGEKAQALDAPHEAIAHFNRALEAAQHVSLPLPTDILRARGKAYETVGYFEAARSDYEQVLNAAQTAHDGATEWQALIDLGFLWTSRDYARTGDYFQRALKLARRIDHPAMIAHSLNRLGNWYANVEQPGEALRYHHEALNLFQTLHDQRGLVETLDLIGMASQLNSDLIQSHQAYQRAIALWYEVSDRWGLASSLASLPLCTVNYLHSLDVPATSLVDAARAGREAISIAREIGWRAGEAYALVNLAMCLGPLGEYGQALSAAHTALWYAEEIEHRQWMTGAHTVLGILYLDVLALDAARSHLERARALAGAIGSRVWMDCATSYLAATCVAQGELGRAETLLQDVLASDTPMQTQAQRLFWATYAELALARDQAQTALRIADELIGSAPSVTAETVIPHTWELRGEALAALGKTREAETVLQAAQAAAFEQGTQRLLWRIHAALGKLYQAQARRDAAQAEFSAAYEIIQRLAANMPDDALRRNFIERARAMLPHHPAPSPARAEKQKFGGLTSREREVTALIVQGKSNREIADELIVGVRTVEAHVTRILNKLGFSSRAQIAAWAVAQGLTRAPQDDN